MSKKYTNPMDKMSYFIPSMIWSGAKTVSYAFAVPSSIRKVIEKDDSYKTHREKLMKLAEKYHEEKLAEKYIGLGDLVGYWSGLAGISFFGVESVYHPDMLKFWFATNCFSFGWESFRKTK